MTENKEEETIKAVADRLKFFFSDANIRGDRFMRRQLSKGEDDYSGSVRVVTLLKFNSIKRHTKDVAVVVEAAKTLEGFLKLEHSDKALARVNPFQSEKMDDNIPLSLYVTNMPVSEPKEGSNERPKYLCTIQDTKKLFDPYGDVALVKFKYHPLHKPQPEKGNNKEDEKDKDDVKMEGTEKKEEEVKKEDVKKEDGKMEDVKKEEDAKKEDIEKKEDEKMEDVKKEDVKKGDENDEDVKKGDENDKDDKKEEAPPEKKRRKHLFVPYVPTGAAQIEFTKIEELEKAAEDLLTTKEGATLEPKKTLELGGNKLDVMLLKEYVAKRKKEKAERKAATGKKGQQEDNQEPTEDNSKKRKVKDEPPQNNTFKIDWKPGCVIRLKGLSKSCDREAIRAAIATALDVTEKEISTKGAYIDYSRGQAEGAIRFPEPLDEIKDLAQKLAEGTVPVAGEKIDSAEVLQGEEEEKYWKTFIEFKSKQTRFRSEERGYRRKKQRR